MDPTPTTIPHDPAAPPRKSRRRWLQFSIRSLLLLTLAVAVVMAFWVVPAMRQRAVLKALSRHGLKQVLYDYDHAAGPAGVPSWLVNIAGIDFFGNVTFVLVDHATDDDLVMVSQLKKLQALYLDGSPVTDAGLSHLRELNNLNTLGLSSRIITDDGLANVGELKNLTSLSLTNTNITDAGLVHIRKLNHLNYLALNGATVTAHGVAELKAAMPDCSIYSDFPVAAQPAKKP